MNRKKFFTSISLGVVGLALFNNLPTRLYSKVFKKSSKAVRVKIHPLAISRKKIGDKNA
jgi:hypothetical protein